MALRQHYSELLPEAYIPVYSASLLFSHSLGPSRSPFGNCTMRTPSRMTPSLSITFHIVYDRNEKPGSFCNLLGFDNTPFCAHLTTSASSPHLVTIVTDNTGCEVQHGMTSSHDWWAASQCSEITWAASNVVTTFEAAHQSPPSFKSA
jgi:hypothetical protein